MISDRDVTLVWGRYCGGDGFMQQQVFSDVQGSIQFDYFPDSDHTYSGFSIEYQAHRECTFCDWFIAVSAKFPNADEYTICLEDGCKMLNVFVPSRDVDASISDAILPACPFSLFVWEMFVIFTL